MRSTRTHSQAGIKAWRHRRAGRQWEEIKAHGAVLMQNARNKTRCRTSDTEASNRSEQRAEPTARGAWNLGWGPILYTVTLEHRSPGLRADTESPPAGQ